MKTSKLSMLIFAVYMTLLCITFMFFPFEFARLTRIDPPDGLWVRVFGMLVGIVAFYYYMAVRDDNVNFYRWTAYGRLAIFPTFLVFVILGIAPLITLLFGAIDTGCGIWTGVALQREKALESSLSPQIT